MNINMLMQQAQRMQKDMEVNVKKAKEELAQTEVHAEAGGGLVKVTMTCRNVVKRIEISPDLLQDDADMIEDLIAAAMNDAARQAEAVSEEKMKVFQEYALDFNENDYASLAANALKIFNISVFYFCL